MASLDFARIGLLAFGALAFGACSGDNLLSDQNLSAVGSDTDTAGSSASAYAVPAKPKPSGGFNPFADTPDGSLGGRVVIANPTLAQVLETGSLPEMSLGRADAPVTIVQYASLTCPHCRAFQRDVFPKLKRNYIDTGKVRFILREFPIGRSSGNAAIALRCVPPSKYFALYGKFLAQQSRWVSEKVRLDKIYLVASQVGLSRAQFDACLKNQDMIGGLSRVKGRGRTLGVIGTPNFFIQNKLVKSVLTYDDLRGRIDALLAAPVASAP